MKKEYLEPVIGIVSFDSDDIIKTSTSSYDFELEDDPFFNR